MHWFLKETNKPGETRCKKVLGPFRRIRFTQSTLRQASIREKKGPSLGKNTSQSSSSAKSLRYEIWGHLKKRLQDSSDVPEARLGILLKHIQVHRRRQGCILLSRGGMGTPGCANKEPEEREFVVDSGASMHMVSKKDLTFRVATLTNKCDFFWGGNYELDNNNNYNSHFLRGQLELDSENNHRPYFLRG